MYIIYPYNITLCWINPSKPMYQRFLNQTVYSLTSSGEHRGLWLQDAAWKNHQGSSVQNPSTFCWFYDNRPFKCCLSVIRLNWGSANASLHHWPRRKSKVHQRCGGEAVEQGFGRSETLQRQFISWWNMRTYAEMIVHLNQGDFLLGASPCTTRPHLLWCLGDRRSLLLLLPQLLHLSGCEKYMVLTGQNKHKNPAILGALLGKKYRQEVFFWKLCGYNSTLDMHSNAQMAFTKIWVGQNCSHHLINLSCSLPFDSGNFSLQGSGLADLPVWIIYLPSGKLT